MYTVSNVIFCVKLFKSETEYQRNLKFQIAPVFWKLYLFPLKMILNQIQSNQRVSCILHGGECTS